MTGYTQKSQGQRRSVLDKAMQQYGQESCVTSISVLLAARDLSSKDRKKLQADKEYLMRTVNPKEPCCSACASGKACSVSASNPASVGNPAFDDEEEDDEDFAPWPGPGRHINSMRALKNKLLR